MKIWNSNLKALASGFVKNYLFYILKTYFIYFTILIHKKKKKKKKKRRRTQAQQPPSKWREVEGGDREGGRGKRRERQILRLWFECEVWTWREREREREKRKKKGKERIKYIIFCYHLATIWLYIYGSKLLKTFGNPHPAEAQFQDMGC